LQALHLSREHKGISTAAEWATSLRAEGSLVDNSISLDSFLQGCAVNWWPTADIPDFPPVGAMETSVCQPFVTARINEIAGCEGQVYRKTDNDDDTNDDNDIISAILFFVIYGLENINGLIYYNTLIFIIEAILKISAMGF
jgi:hypothetical protein